MTFQAISYDHILPMQPDSLPDHRVLSIMDIYLSRTLDGWLELMRLRADTPAYVELEQRVSHWSRTYRQWLSYIYSNRSYRVWNEHFNRWPNENDCLQASHRAEPQLPAFLPQPR
jgi:hypothetical protein